MHKILLGLLLGLTFFVCGCGEQITEDFTVEIKYINTPNLDTITVRVYDDNATFFIDDNASLCCYDGFHAPFIVTTYIRRFKIINKKTLHDKRPIITS